MSTASTTPATIIATAIAIIIANASTIATTGIGLRTKSSSTWAGGLVADGLMGW